jgi:hypothetical protein
MSLFALTVKSVEIKYELKHRKQVVDLFYAFLNSGHETSNIVSFQITLFYYLMENPSN